MSFFEEIGKKASATYKATADKTSKIAKEAKLKILINDDESKISEIYEEIGKKIYEMYQKDKDQEYPADLKDSLTKIDALNEEINDTKNELLKLKKERFLF